MINLHMSKPEIMTFAALNEHVRTLESPTIVAIDGRSGSGKTTFANRLSSALNASVVHTDDVAWHHSFFDWWEVLIENILEPFKAGKSVDWKPEIWTARGRDGSIVVPAAPVFILEGVSSTRLEYRHWIDVPIWIETDSLIAEQRGLARDGEAERDFWFEWQAAERPLLEKDQPWTRAKLIVDGATTVQHDPNTEFVAIANRLTG
jgi:energy-coupling factor transporter ATP-binding protein EcfA2